MAQNINDNLTELVKAILDLLATQEDCCAAGTATIDSPPSDGQVDVGQGEQFPDQATYLNAKCQAANWIYDGLHSSVVGMISGRVDILGGVYGGIVAGVTTALILTGPPGWVAALAEVTIVALAGILTGVAFELSSLKDALEEQQEDAVKALYNSSNAANAKDNFIAQLNAATVPPSSTEIFLVGLMLRSSVANMLFAPSQDILNYTPVSAVDCGDTIQVWTFDSSNGGWAFDAALSGANCSATWSDIDDAWLMTVGGPGTQWSVIKITGLSIAVSPGDSFQFDFGPGSNGYNTSYQARAIYSDTSEFVSYGDTTGAGTRILTFTQAGTISELRIEVGRQFGGDTTSYYTPIDEARVQ